MIDIGLKIKRIREYKNYTQEYMSDRLDISQNTYSKIETGGIKLTTERLQKISDILEVPVESLLSNENQTLNLSNNHIEKFYGYIETIQEENKELTKILNDQILYLQKENERLLRTIEKLTDK